MFMIVQKRICSKQATTNDSSVASHRLRNQRRRLSRGDGDAGARSGLGRRRLRAGEKRVSEKLRNLGEGEGEARHSKKRKVGS